MSVDFRTACRWCRCRGSRKPEAAGWPVLSEASQPIWWVSSNGKEQSGAHRGTTSLRQAQHAHLSERVRQACQGLARQEQAVRLLGQTGVSHAAVWRRVLLGGGAGGQPFQLSSRMLEVNGWLDILLLSRP